MSIAVPQLIIDQKVFVVHLVETARAHAFDDLVRESHGRRETNILTDQLAVE